MLTAKWFPAAIVTTMIVLLLFTQREPNHVATLAVTTFPLSVLHKQPSKVVLQTEGHVNDPDVGTVPKLSNIQFPNASWRFREGLCPKSHFLESHLGEPAHGDVCRGDEGKWNCPSSCSLAPKKRAPYCVEATLPADTTLRQCRIQVEVTASTPHTLRDWSSGPNASLPTPFFGTNAKSTPPVRSHKALKRTLQSSWHDHDEANHDFNRKCAPYIAVVQTAQVSRHIPIHGIMIGDADNPGNNGIGDRVRGVVGTAILAAALDRPFKFAIKPNVWHPEIVAFTSEWPESWDEWYHTYATGNTVVIEGFPDVDRFFKLLSVSTDKPILLALEGGSPTDVWASLTHPVFGNLTKAEQGLAWGCVARALFQPQPHIVRELDTLLAAAVTKTALLSSGQMGELVAASPSDPVDFEFLLGVHARYGDSEVDKRMSNEQVRLQIACGLSMTEAWYLRSDHTPSSSVIKPKATKANSDIPLQTRARTNAVWLIASDRPTEFFNTTMEYMIQRQADSGALMNTITLVRNTIGDAIHVKDSVAVSGIHRLWLDFFLLTEAVSCTYGRSGFPGMACSMSSRLILHKGRNRPWADDGCLTWQD